MKLNLENHITGKIKRIHKYWFITDYDLKNTSQNILMRYLNILPVQLHPDGRGFNLTVFCYDFCVKHFYM